MQRKPSRGVSKIALNKSINCSVNVEMPDFMKPPFDEKSQTLGKNPSSS